MKMSGNTILITGGASGIGLAFAERFVTDLHGDEQPDEVSSSRFK